MSQFDRDARVNVGVDGAVYLYLFSKGKLLGGGSKRYAVVSFEGDGAAILLNDREAEEGKQIVACVDVSVHSLGVWLMRAEEFLRGVD